MLVRLLARGHLRARWRRHVALAVVFLLGLLAFTAVLSVLAGARDSLVAPLRATISGPVRVTENTTDLGGGRVWHDYRPIQSQLERATASAAIPRFESSYITVQGADIEHWSAGLLVGLDPARDPRVADARAYLTWGRMLPDTYVYDENGTAHVPLVLGHAAVKRLNLSLPGSGRPDFASPLTITSGHSVGGSSNFPLTIEAVIVGVFSTGLDPLDKFSAFIPIQHARYLAGYAEEDPVANAFLLEASDPAAADRAVERLGFKSQTSHEYALTYMGSMLVVLYGAAALGLALFLLILLVWTVHETSAFLRQDEPVLASLRAIGVPAGAIQRSYLSIMTGTVAAGAMGAFFLGLVLLPLVPPVGWHLSGLTARIELPPMPGEALGLAAVSILAGAASTWWTVRRVGARSILAGLRRG